MYHYDGHNEYDERALDTRRGVDADGIVDRTDSRILLMLPTLTSSSEHALRVVET